MAGAATIATKGIATKGILHFTISVRDHVKAAQYDAILCLSLKPGFLAAGGEKAHSGASKNGA